MMRLACNIFATCPSSAHWERKGVGISIRQKTLWGLFHLFHSGFTCFECNNEASLLKGASRSARRGAPPRLGAVGCPFSVFCSAPIFEKRRFRQVARMQTLEGAAGGAAGAEGLTFRQVFYWQTDGLIIMNQ